MLIGIGTVIGKSEEKIYCLSFDGVDDYVTVPSSALYNVDNSASFTIEFEFMTTYTGIATAVSRSSSYFRFYGGYNDGIYGQIIGSTIQKNNLGAADGKWHHVAYVVDRDIDGNGSFSCYLDGVLVESDNLIENTDGVTSGNLHFGCLFGDRNFFNGKLKDIRFWKVARTPTDINENMFKKLTGLETGLVGYWPLDDGHGNVAHDLTTNNNHGAITGATWVEVVE